ncbi:MAG TPA: hypothetical protein VK698_35100 [Kofleriaceae bacterium]|nr:hypothetical protein [Kofleriaceae bacterium]
MAERPDLREIASSLREALGGLERDALVEILTYVLNEYVVEGPPPLAAAQVERLEDLAGLSLAGLVGALQTRLDVPGLELFRIEGDEVRVQTSAGWVALQPGRAPAPAFGDRAAAAPVPPAASSRAAEPAEGRAGARFVEQPMARPTPPAIPPPQPTGRAAADEALARGRGDLVGDQRGVITPPAPRPRGLSVSGRPTASPSPWTPPREGAAPPPAPPPGQEAAPPPSSTQPPTTPPAQPGEKPAARDEDDASIRFSLLELD